MPNFGQHFKQEEFDSPDQPGSGINMQQVFLDKLNHAREIAGVPFKINSGYRTKAHNAKVGGVSDSAHGAGLAADISTGDGRSRWVILNALIKAGFTRLGIANTYIHADCDTSLPQEVIWGYYK